MDQNTSTPKPQTGNAQTKPAVAAAKKEGGFHRFLRMTLGTDTKFGRGMRAFLRTAALVVGMFALGLLSCYLLLLQPAQKELAVNQANLVKAQADLETTQKDLKTAQDKLQAADLLSKDKDKNLTVGESHILLLQIMNEVTDARLSLEQKYSFNAKTTLTGVQADLKELAGLTGSSATGADTLEAAQSRLTLSISEITQDADTAATDLEILSDLLGKLETELFPE